MAQGTANQNVHETDATLHGDVKSKEAAAAVLAAQQKAFARTAKCAELGDDAEPKVRKGGASSTTAARDPNAPKPEPKRTGMDQELVKMQRESMSIRMLHSELSASCVAQDTILAGVLAEYVKNIQNFRVELEAALVTKDEPRQKQIWENYLAEKQKGGTLESLGDDLMFARQRTKKLKPVAAKK